MGSQSVSQSRPRPYTHPMHSKCIHARPFQAACVYVCVYAARYLHVIRSWYYHHRCIDIRKYRCIKAFQQTKNNEFSLAYQLRTGSQMERMFYFLFHLWFASKCIETIAALQWSGLVYQYAFPSFLYFATQTSNFWWFETFFYGQFIVSGSSCLMGS